MKSQADYSAFEALDVRVGKIVKVEDSLSKKPTYRLTVDFGSEIGVKVSCGAYRNYSKDELMGKQVVGVVNFAPKKMGPEISEVLILGVSNEKGETIYLTTQSEVALGQKIF
jgi:tRNA-binding protein